MASDTRVRVLDGSLQIAQHARTYDRHQFVLDPVHQEAVLKLKRKAIHFMPLSHLEQAVPESKEFLDQAFAHGESAGAQTSQLMKLLEQYGITAVRRAVVEALERNTPRASSVARHPQAQSLDVRPHDLETYDDLARTKNTDHNDDDAKQ